MFEDSLLESRGALRRRSPWPATLSFALQAGIAAILVLLPLLFTEALPWRPWTTVVASPTPPPAAAPSATNTRVRTSTGRPLLAEGILRTPTLIPGRIAMLHDDETEAAAAGATSQVMMGVPGGTGTSTPDSLISKVIQTAPAIPRVVIPAKVRVSSGVAQGLLIVQAKPAYPALALQARIQGMVVLQAVIGKDGNVHDLRVISGHPLLVQAAIEAVKQWRYRPYLLNDEPVEVDTQVNVNFSLGAR